MRSIYQAIRQAKDLRKTAGGAPLRIFESANRGHQHLLDELAAGEPQAGWREGSDARRSQLLLSLRNLLSDLKSTVGSGLAGREWDAILDAEDSTGCLEQLTLRMARESMSSKLGENLWITTPALTFTDGIVDIRLEIQQTLSMPTKLELKASRRLPFSCKRPNTLRNARALLVEASRQRVVLLRDANEWPEFSKEKSDKLYTQALLQRFEKLLQVNFPGADREMLRRLKPTI